VSQPVVFAAVAEVELGPAPIPQHWIIEGTPLARSKRLATSADGAAAVIAWSCTPGRFRWRYTSDEISHVISGEVFVTDEKGDSRRLGPGDMAYFPAGSQSTWHVTQEMKKLAICRQHMPRPLGYALRAWNKLAAIVSSAAEDSGPLENGAGVGADTKGVTAV
jgi:uncharacterized cupin superfamily protein